MHSRSKNTATVQKIRVQREPTRGENGKSGQNSTIKTLQIRNFAKFLTAESVAIATSVPELACTETSRVVENRQRSDSDDDSDESLKSQKNTSKIDTSPLNIIISETAGPKRLKLGTL